MGSTRTEKAEEMGFLEELAEKKGDEFFLKRGKRGARVIMRRSRGGASEEGGIEKSSKPDPC